MNFALSKGKRRDAIRLAIALVCVAIFVVYEFRQGGGWFSVNPSSPSLAAPSDVPGTAPTDPNSITLTATQQESVKVEAVEEHPFPLQKAAVGSIDFNEDMEVQVFTPYQ